MIRGKRDERSSKTLKYHCVFNLFKIIPETIKIKPIKVSFSASSLLSFKLKIQYRANIKELNIARKTPRVLDFLF